MKVVIFTNAYDPIVSGWLRPSVFTRACRSDMRFTSCSGSQGYTGSPKDRAEGSSLFRSEPYQTIAFSDCRALLSVSPHYYGELIG